MTQNTAVDESIVKKEGEGCPAMNILYCGDKGIKDGVLVSILSILKYNAGPLHIYIATINYETTVAFTDKSTEFLDKLVKGKVAGLPAELAKNTNLQNFVKKIDATEVFVENLPKKNMGSYFTPCSMLRLYADKMPELTKCDKILYLDYDVVCRGPLREFYDTSLDDVETAGALDIYGKHFYHYHGLKQDYMNSGVMLFNMVECRKNHTLEKAAKKCAERWMMLADQAALNKVIKKRKILPRKYNEQGERPREDTVLHHFSNNFKFLPVFHVQKVKPFEVEKIHKVLKIREYDDILKVYMELKDNL